jgi:trimethylamine:corrinoid methyltransferase-like protein
MKTTIQVLSEEESARIHEASLDILETTGVRVETAQGRRILK